MSTSERYVLATGDEGAYRLRVVNSVHGSDTEAFLLRAGLRPRMRVADVGCGIGTISCWIAQQVGPNGTVDGVDISEAQIHQARAAASSAGLTNAGFQAATAYKTGLERGAYDLVFCRFLLMHLSRPEDALAEMAALVRPGGILACEDGDFSSPFSEPSSQAYARCFELYRAVVAARGGDPLIGPKLYRMFLRAGMRQPEVALAQPVFVQGEAKRLPEWTLEECGPALLEHGMAHQEEIDRVAGELKSLAEDETTFFAMAQMTQVWAIR
jgi:ubiquinone/menaquinone biosynthesis C-methylase UbiE